MWWAASTNASSTFSVRSTMETVFYFQKARCAVNMVSVLDTRRRLNYINCGFADIVTLSYGGIRSPCLRSKKAVLKKGMDS